LKYPKEAAHVSKFLLENFPAVQSQFTESEKEVDILSKLASEISKGFTETVLGKILFINTRILCKTTQP
jgi:hypothetical protein